MYWNPEKQFPHLEIRIVCMACGGPVERGGNGLPRLVAGFNRRKLVSAQKYRHRQCPCANCPGGSTTFDAKHPKVMQEMIPATVAHLLNVVFTHRGALDYELLMHVDHDVMKGTSFQAACERVGTFLRRNHNEAELAFMHRWGHLQRAGAQTRLD